MLSEYVRSGFELGSTGLAGLCVFGYVCVRVCVMVSRRAAERSVFSREATGGMEQGDRVTGG